MYPCEQGEEKMEGFHRVFDSLAGIMSSGIDLECRIYEVNGGVPE